MLLQVRTHTYVDTPVYTRGVLIRINANIIGIVVPILMVSDKKATVYTLIIAPITNFFVVKGDK